MQLFIRVLKGCCLLMVLFAIFLIIIMPNFFRLLAEVILELNSR
ncbi:MAG: hypothetical protein R2834_22700 [Rhodothermales bacterium]